MARAMWKGAMAFGLVSIPVEYKENLMRVDLMTRLRASLEGCGWKGGGAGSGAATQRKSAAAWKRTGSRTSARKRRVA